eukprot:11574004-Heterocapsa_arctica.AAC.1
MPKAALLWKASRARALKRRGAAWPAASPSSGREGAFREAHEMPRRSSCRVRRLRLARRASRGPERRSVSCGPGGGAHQANPRRRCNPP